MLEPVLFQLWINLFRSRFYVPAKLAEGVTLNDFSTGRHHRCGPFPPLIVEFILVDTKCSSFPLWGVSRNITFQYQLITRTLADVFGTQEFSDNYVCALGRSDAENNAAFSCDLNPAPPSPGHTHALPGRLH